MNLLKIYIIVISIVSCTEIANSGPRFIFKSHSDREVVAMINGEKIIYKDLMRGIDADVFDLEQKIYELKMNRLRALALEKLMMADPKKKGLSNDEYLDLYMAKGVDVSSKEISDFISNKQIPTSQINDTLKQQIKNFLLSEKKKVAVDRWMGEKTRSNPVEVYFKVPKRPVFDIPITVEDAQLGRSDAPVTIVEFSDFQCSFCAKGNSQLQELKRIYGHKIRLVHKNFPLPFHPKAKDSAVFALCAGEQHSLNFWKVHDLLYQEQDNLNTEVFTKIGKRLGLDVPELMKCFNAKRPMKKVEKDIELGQNLGIKSTPTYYVNGMLINGALPMDVFTEIINDELKANSL